MWKGLSTRIASVFIVMILGAGISAPARAGVPVIDVANLAQAIQQVLSWAQQLEGMEQQYQQLTSTYESLIGPRGMQNLMPLSIAQRNYLPPTYSELQGIMRGSSGAYPALAAQVQGSVQSNAILTGADISSLPAPAQAYLDQTRRSAATLAMLSSQTQSAASSSFSKIQGLISALGSTQDTKASADLSGRIQSEQVMTQTNQIKSDALYQAVQAQQLQSAQAARELSVKSLGQMSDLPPIAW